MGTHVGPKIIVFLLFVLLWVQGQANAPHPDQLIREKLHWHNDPSLPCAGKFMEPEKLPVVAKMKLFVPELIFAQQEVDKVIVKGPAQINWQNYKLVANGFTQETTEDGLVKYHFRNGVDVQGDDFYIYADTGDYDKQNKIGNLDRLLWIRHSSESSGDPWWGQADALSFAVKEKTAKVRNIVISSCPLDNLAWRIHAQTTEFSPDLLALKLRNVRFEWYGHRLFNFPIMLIPLSPSPISGFLFPKIAWNSGRLSYLQRIYYKGKQNFDLGFGILFDGLTRLGVNGHITDTHTNHYGQLKFGHMFGINNTAKGANISAWQLHERLNSHGQILDVKVKNIPELSESWPNSLFPAGSATKLVRLVWQSTTKFFNSQLVWREQKSVNQDVDDSYTLQPAFSLWETAQFGGLELSGNLDFRKFKPVDATNAALVPGQRISLHADANYRLTGERYLAKLATSFDIRAWRWQDAVHNQHDTNIMVPSFDFSLILRQAEPDVQLIYQKIYVPWVKQDAVWFDTSWPQLDSLELGRRQAWWGGDFINDENVNIIKAKFWPYAEHSTTFSLWQRSGGHWCNALGIDCEKVPLYGKRGALVTEDIKVAEDWELSFSQAIPGTATLIRLEHVEQSLPLFLALHHEKMHPEARQSFAKDFGVLGWQLPINRKWQLESLLEYNFTARDLSNLELGVGYTHCCWQLSLDYVRERLRDNGFNNTIKLDFKLGGLENSAKRLGSNHILDVVTNS